MGAICGNWVVSKGDVVNWPIGGILMSYCASIYDALCYGFACKGYRWLYFAINARC
jgi:hypothetical protein